MENLPKEVSRGKVNIGGIELECVVLDNGQRLFAGEAIEELMQAFNLKENPK